MTNEKRLERAKEYYYDGGTPEYTKFALEDIFPELKESDDELTRKDLLEYVKHCVCDRDVCKEERDKWLAWLEKQGEPKWSEEDKKSIEDFINHFIEDYSPLSNNELNVVNWLKSLKQRMGGMNYGHD